MAADLQSIINNLGENNEQRRTLDQGFYDALTTVLQATGNNFPDIANSSQNPISKAPNPGTLSVSGANGVYTANVVNAAQGGINAAIYIELSYSTIQSFGQNVTREPISTATTFNVPSPGSTLFFRARWSFDQANWSSYVTGTTAVAAGLQSSAASENNTPLNITNYAYVDSVDSGSSATVRVYGAAGPYNGFVSVKGGVESQKPSGTIINVAKSTTQIVSYDGEQYQVRPTLPGVFPDSWTPVGQVNVVGSGSPTLPNIVLLVQSGYVVGIKSSSTFGTGLTQVPTFVVTDSTGAGATIIATGLSGGAITGIQVTNGGNGLYSSSPTATASGGVFSGSTGGGTAVGGNGGRLTAI